MNKKRTRKAQLKARLCDLKGISGLKRTHLSEYALFPQNLLVSGSLVLDPCRPFNDLEARISKLEKRLSEHCRNSRDNSVRLHRK